MKVASLLTCLLLSKAWLFCQNSDSLKVVNLDNGKTVYFTKVEIESAFKGGMSAWQKFVKKNLRYPQDAFENDTQGTAVISFTIDTTGHISDLKILSDPGGGLGQEALRIIKLTDGMWEPSIQNGLKVKSYKRQPINFEKR